MNLEVEKNNEQIIPKWTESRVIRPQDLPEVLDPDVIDKILSLMTPAEILASTEFSPPEVILPWNFPNFESLLARREDIRLLRLLPVKNDEGYKTYHDQSIESLVKEIEEYLAGGSIVLATNKFPYYMPVDTSQDIVWMKDPNTSNTDLAKFLSGVISLLNLSADQVIIFERPIQTNSRIVKGTLPQYRHVHLWSKLQLTDEIN